MDPRISFSNDFVDTHQATKYEAPASSDFEFSVKDYSMIPADEIFFKGTMLPLKENCRKITLREELLVDDEEDGFALPRMSKSSGWWKERLGLKRGGHMVSKRGDRNNSNGVLERVVEERSTVFVHENGFGTKSTQQNY